MSNHLRMATARGLSRAFLVKACKTLGFAPFGATAEWLATPKPWGLPIGLRPIATTGPGPVYVVSCDTALLRLHRVGSAPRQHVAQVLRAGLPHTTANLWLSRSDRRCLVVARITAVVKSGSRVRLSRSAPCDGARQWGRGSVA